MSQEKYKLSFTLKPKEPITVFALVIGGFYPFFCIPSQILLLDRNIASNALNIINKGKHKDNQANSWWHSFINTSNFMLNPMLRALEGSKQKIPTFEEFCSEFEKSREILAKAFPKAKVPHYSDEHYQSAYALVSEVTGDYSSEAEFLKAAAPLLVNKNSSSKLKKIEDQVMDLAKSSGLKRITFSILACLSCLYESSNNRSIGRDIIKPKHSYTNKMAHNALMDLYSLGILIQANAKLNTQIALCTSDKGLSKFWCCLGVKPGYTDTPNGFNFNMELKQELFAKLNQEEFLSLMQRIEAYTF